MGCGLCSGWTVHIIIKGIKGIIINNSDHVKTEQAFKGIELMVELELFCSKFTILGSNFGILVWLEICYLAKLTILWV